MEDCVRRAAKCSEALRKSRQLSRAPVGRLSGGEFHFGNGQMATLSHWQGAALEQHVLGSNASMDPQVLQLQAINSLHSSQLTDKFFFKNNPSGISPWLPQSKWKISNDYEVGSKANNLA